MTRKVRLSGGESVEERAYRLAELAIAQRPHMKPAFVGHLREFFVAGYLAAVDDTVEVKP